MCRAIYVLLIGLFYVYSDWVLDQHRLSVTAGGGDWMPVAVQWEIATALWPLLVLAALLASAVTFVVMGGGKRECATGCSDDSR
jgi:hypothetical protein